MTPFFDTTSNRVLTAHDIENLGLNGHETSKPFLNRGLRPIGLKSNDHLRSVKDMIEFIEGGQICRENREMKSKIGKPEFLSCFTYDSLKLY